MHKTTEALPGSVLVMGAGSVGCYVGGCLAAAGVDVQFVGRARVLEALRSQGLTVSDLDGAKHQLAPAQLKLASVVPPDATPALVLLCVKSGSTAQAAAELASLAPATLVLSLQNGLSNAEVASQVAPSLQVLPAMVPYNVAEIAPGAYHRGTGGQLAVQQQSEGRTDLARWQSIFARAGVAMKIYEDLRPVQWGKLLVNLNNPVNALSGLALRDELMQRGYRRCLAALVEEGLQVLNQAGITPAQVLPLPYRKFIAVLRLPTFVFKRVAKRMLQIDPQARSSMADDLARGRRTEIGELCGEIVRLAQAQGTTAPRSAAMVAALENWSAQSTHWSPQQMLSALKL